jgi:prepilin-type N-terminal cleavage/methylation domain-containing protein
MNSCLKKSFTPLEIRPRRPLTVASGKPSLRGLTLIELLIAIVLLSVIILAISNIDLFTRFHTISADRRVKLQNGVSYVLEHMTKEISRAIGNVVIDGINNIVNFTPIAGDTAIRVYIDSNATGGPGDGRRDAINDRWIAYRYRDASAPVNERYQIWYYANCVGPNCNQPGTIGPEVIARNIADFSRSVNNNVVEVAVTGRWDPSQAASSDNPEVVMRTKIKMPSVSTH